MSAPHTGPACHLANGEIRRDSSGRTGPRNQNPAPAIGFVSRLDIARGVPAERAAPPPPAESAEAHPERKVSGMISAALRAAQSRLGTFSIARRCAISSRALASA